jgi:hypothetical protein
MRGCSTSTLATYGKSALYFSKMARLLRANPWPTAFVGLGRQIVNDLGGKVERRLMANSASSTMALEANIATFV